MYWKTNFITNTTEIEDSLRDARLTLFSSIEKADTFEEMIEGIKTLQKLEYLADNLIKAKQKERWPKQKGEVK